MKRISKPYIFITGAPRSGTSMITKIIDSHPDIGIFMENIFGLRRRHWQFPAFWNNDDDLFHVVCDDYNKLSEPVVGNKVCTPDVWNTDEILRMCNFFVSSKLVFVVRNPVDVINSRINREESDHFSDSALSFLGLDWSNKYTTYISSWRQSVEVYWKLRDVFHDNIMIIYYDDFVSDSSKYTDDLFAFLGMPAHENVYNWYNFPHHNSKGELTTDLKYKDEPVKKMGFGANLPDDAEKHLTGLPHYKLWLNRAL